MTKSEERTLWRKGDRTFYQTYHLLSTKVTYQIRSAGKIRFQIQITRTRYCSQYWLVRNAHIPSIGGHWSWPVGVDNPRIVRRLSCHDKDASCRETRNEKDLSLSCSQLPHGDNVLTLFILCSVFVLTLISLCSDTCKLGTVTCTNLGEILKRWNHFHITCYMKRVMWEMQRCKALKNSCQHPTHTFRNDLNRWWIPWGGRNRKHIFFIHIKEKSRAQIKIASIAPHYCPHRNCAFSICNGDGSRNRRALWCVTRVGENNESSDEI